MGHKKATLSNPTAGSHTSRTPPLSPDARQALDAEAPGGNDSQMDDDNPLSGASDHPLSDADLEAEHESSTVESSDENDGEDASGKDVSMDAETTSQPALPAAQDSGNAIHLLQPCNGDNTIAEPHYSYRPGSSLWQPWWHFKRFQCNPDPSAALAYAIQARVLTSPALAVVMAQNRAWFRLRRWGRRQGPARGVPRRDARSPGCCPDHVRRLREGQLGCAECGEQIHVRSHLT